MPAAITVQTERHHRPKQVTTTYSFIRPQTDQRAVHGLRLVLHVAVLRVGGIWFGRMLAPPATRDATSATDIPVPRSRPTRCVRTARTTPRHTCVAPANTSPRRFLPT